MKSTNFLLIGTVIATLLNGCCTTTPTAIQEVSPKLESKPVVTKSVVKEKPKLYLTTTPIEKSQAFMTFLDGPKTERAKLDYLLDRIREAKSATFYLDGSQYQWTDAYAAGNWILWRRYKPGEDARSFLQREVSYTPNRAAFMTLAPGSKFPVYSALLNELTLLEEKTQDSSFSSSTIPTPA